MAVDAYVGLPRSGKSYSVVKNVILPSLREGRDVYTNIPLRPKAFEEFPGQIHVIDDEMLVHPDMCDMFPKGCVVVLDELWKRWPAGIKANQFNKKDMELLAMHGHKVDEHGRTTRVVLVVQDLSDIAAYPRGKVAMTYRSEKLDAVGATGRFKIDIYRGPVTGVRPSKSTFVRSTFDKYEEEYYQWYFTSTQSDTGDAGDESRADARGSVWRSPKLWTYIFMILFFPIAGAYGLYNFFSGPIAQVEQVSAPQASLPLVNPPPPGMDLSPPAKQPETHVSSGSEPLVGASAFWRVAGFVDAAKGQDSSKLRSRVVLVGDNGATRFLPMSDCQYYPDGIYVYCDVDGSRVTPWTGRAAATAVFGSTASQPGTDTARSERSDPRAVSVPASSAKPPSSGVTVTGIPYTPTPRTLL